MKTCSKCGTKKLEEYFSKCSASKDGLYTYCKECKGLDNKKYRDGHKKYNRVWKKRHYQINKGKIAIREKRYYQDNKEKILARNKKYQRVNRDKMNEYSRKYAENNPDRRKLSNKICNHKRRAVIEDTEITLEQVNKLIEDSNNICFWCDIDIEKMHLDHVYPLSKGGGHTISNLVVSCSTCNLRKNAKDPEVWLDEILGVA